MEYPYSSGAKDVNYIVLEIAERGELFDFVANTGAFSEHVARYFFKQLLNGLEALHNNNTYHRDMKAENLFIDEHFNLKIGDFGFSKNSEQGDEDGMFLTQLGTPGYMAPEIILGQPYFGHHVDVFASGVILFVMIARGQPFGQASPRDKFYKTLAMGKKDNFWGTHINNQEDGNIFDDDFRDLCERIWALDPNQRITL